MTMHPPAPASPFSPGFCLLTATRLPLLALVVALACALTPSGAQAGPHSPTTAAVALGDSFISGEAGRWQGNSIDPTLCRRGTDRGCTLDATGLIPTYNSSSVYLGDSDANGCHRSDVSEILTAGLAVDEPINIACSGAVTANIWRASQGGQADKTETAIPDAPFSFKQLKRAQAVGDFQTLEAHDRRTVRIHFDRGVDPVAWLRDLFGSSRADGRT